MKLYSDKVLGKATGLAMVNAIVTVLLAGTQTKATLFAVNDDTTAPIANPIITDTTGRFGFYVENGLYDITIGSPTGAVVTLQAVEIFDLVTISAELAALAASVGSAAGSSSSAGASAATAVTAQVAAASSAIAASNNLAAIEAIGAVGASRMFETWAALSAVAGAANDGALVLDTDAGTHNDPVTGAAVNNGGIYRYVVGGGWKRIGATAAALASPALTTAVQNAAAVAVDNRRNKIVFGNLVAGLIDPAGNPQVANDWRTFTVAVTPGGTVTTNLLFPNNSGIKFLRADGSVVQVVPGTGANGAGTLALAGAQINVPAGAVFMQASALLYRFVSDGSNDQILFPHLVLLEGTVALPSLFSDALLYDPTRIAIQNQWVGRKVGAIGDSYWSGRLWYMQLQADLGLQLTNFSQGGRTMSGALKDANGAPLSQASVAGLDALILSLHTNSAAAGLPVGLSTDGPAAFDGNGNCAGASYFSQAAGAIETLAGWNPNMLIVLGTPLYRVGVPLINDYYPAIRTLADMWGCALIEPHRKCGVNAATAGTLLIDGVHLTEPNFSSRYRSAWRDGFQRLSPVS